MDGSKAREQEGDRMADALVDGNGDASWQVDDSDYKQVDRITTPAASMMAVALNDAFSMNRFDGFVSASYNMIDQRMEVHVNKDYFFATYAVPYEAVEQPRHGYIQHGVAVGEAYVYCLEMAEFKMVRVRADG